jgi:proteasome lid subunit RPN8/RPN11
MIEIIVSDKCVAKLRRELARAGSDEIGGVLAAENLGDGRFLVLDLSVQRDGSFASFARSSPRHGRFIRRFLQQYGHDYQRFNYLGEWHSHPSFPAMPSLPDLRQMQRLIEEPNQRALFLALLVLKLGRSGSLEGSAHAFRRGFAPLRVGLSAAVPLDLRPPASAWGWTPRASVWRCRSRGRTRRIA